MQASNAAMTGCAGPVEAQPYCNQMVCLLVHQHPALYGPAQAVLRLTYAEAVIRFD